MKLLKFRRPPTEPSSPSPHRRLTARERLGLGAAGLAVAAGSFLPIAASSGGGDHVAPASSTTSTVVLSPPSISPTTPSSTTAPVETTPAPPPAPPAPPPKPPPLTNAIAEQLAPQVTQLAPGIVQGTIDGGTLVAADFTVPGVRFQLAGPEHAGQLPQTVLGEVPGAVAVMNGQMFHFGADHPEVLDGTQNMLGVLGNARANGVDWPAGQAVPEGAYLEFGKWGARLVTDGRPMAADAVDVIGVHDIVWQDGVSLEPQLGDSSFIQGHFGRTIYAVSEDGSHFYSWVNDAHHGLSVPQAAQKLVDMVNAMGLPPVKYAFNQDGGGSSSIATTGGVNDTLGRPLVSTATLVFDANANATGTFVDWTPPPRPHGKPAI